MWSRQHKASHTVEEQLALLRQEITTGETTLVEKEAELADLRIELAAFQLKYEVQIGRKLQEQERLEAQIADCKRQIDEYRRWGAGGRPKAEDGSPFVSVEEQYRRTWKEPDPPGPWFPPPMSAEAEQTLKSLYRQLCRRFHPDLTQDPKERAWRTEMMAAVNAAYEAQSLAELQALAAQPARPVSERAGTDRQRLDALRKRGYDAVHQAAASVWQDALGERVTLATYDTYLWAAAESIGLEAHPADLPVMLETCKATRRSL